MKISINQTIKKNRRVLFALTMSSLIIFPTSSFAEQPASGCDAVLNVGVYNINHSSSSSESEQVTLSTFCSEDYSKVDSSSSSAKSIEISYGAASIGGTASKSKSNIVEKQQQLCTNSFGSEKYLSTVSQESKTINGETIKAWEQCVAIEKSGITFKVAPDSTMQGISITMSTPSNVLGATLKGIAQTGSGHSICTTQLPARSGSNAGKLIILDDSTTVHFVSPLTVICNRELSINPKTDEKFADAQTILFNTSAGSYQVPMAAIGLSSRVSADEIKSQSLEQAKDEDQKILQQAKDEDRKLVAQITSNEAKITSNKTSLDAAAIRLNGIHLDCKYVRAKGQDATCPTGYTVTGCTAGKNKASNNPTNDQQTCHTQDGTDWTAAYCCSVQQ